MNPDFVDFLSALIAAEVRFLIVGAHALAVHGIPRATGDIDVWVDRSSENAARDRLDVPFLGREALIRNKRAAGRLKDLGDLEALGGGD